jgi:hypothetical protein
MGNTTRYQRSRAAILQAAQVVITCDGPSRLTMDATEIAVAQEAAITQQSVSLVIMSIFAEEPELLSAFRAESVEKMLSIVRT